MTEEVSVLNFVAMFVWLSTWKRVSFVPKVFKNILQYSGDMKCHPANIYLFKVNNRNSRKRFEICSKLTIKTPERSQWRRFVVFVANFKHIPHLFLVFLLLTLNKQVVFCLLNRHSSHSEVSSNKVVPKKFVKFFAGLRFATLLKKKLWHRCFPVNIAKFLKTRFL